MDSYRDHLLIFYGSTHCALPRQLFILFEKCRTRYGKHPDLVKRWSHSDLTFSEEKTEAIQKRKKEQPFTLTGRNTVMWVSLFPSVKKEDSWYFAIGMGPWEDQRTEKGMMEMDARNQLVIQADRYLKDTVYRRLTNFKKLNPLRYLKEYCYLEKKRSEDERALENRFDCTWCENQEKCEFLTCAQNRAKAFRAFEEHRLEPEEVQKIRAAEEECFPVAVIDMEWEGQNPTQFSGFILEPCENGLRVTDELNIYIKLPAGKRVSPMVRGLTHITDELLKKEGLTVYAALNKITGFLNKAKLVCGQGVRSDLDVLNRFYEENGQKVPACVSCEKIIDVSFLVQDMNDLEHVVSLKEEAQLTGVVHWKERFHDARVDALLAARLLAVYLPGFVLRYRTAPIVPVALVRKVEGAALLTDFDGNPKHNDKKNGRR